MLTFLSFQCMGLYLRAGFEGCLKTIALNYKTDYCINVQALCKKTIPKVNIKIECICLGSNSSGKERFSQLQTSLKGEQVKFSNVERMVELEGMFRDVE